MKLLMVTMGLDIGGAETHIVELCRGLAAMGHDVSVASNGGVYEKELMDCGITHIKLPLNTKNPAALIKSYNGLKKLIKEGNFDVVHAHARIPAFICSLVRKTVDFRFTTTAHLDFKVNPLLKLLTDWGEKSLAVSKDIATYLTENYGVKPENISLTINGIDSDKFSPDTDTSDVISEFGLSGSSTKIVYISRLDPDRSLIAFHLISIADRICEKFGDIEFVIVGAGGDYDKLVQLAEQANRKIGRRAIVLTGARTDINKFAALSDIFIAVSRSALEAMSAAKPVIVAGNQGYMGIFDESKLQDGIATNFCCRGLAAAAPEYLYDDLSALLSMNPDRLAEMGQYNRSVVMKHYSVSRMANDYIDLYKSLPTYTDFHNADIVMSGYYGFDNMGDDALLGVISENLREVNPAIKVLALTIKPKKITAETAIRSISRTNYIEIYRQLSHAKVLISGGGTLLQDATSVKSLFYYLSIMRIAKKRGAKLFIYANGAGPIYRRSSKKAAADVLKLADKISVREPNAKDTLISLGIDEKQIAVTADPAFMIKPTGSLSELCSRYNVDNKTKYYAVSLRECIGKTAKNLDLAELSDKIGQICRELKENYGLEPVFIPMQPKYDNEICKKIKALLGFGVVAENLTAGELCTFLTRMEFVIGMRLHMLVFASHMNIPMVALSYDPKINGLMSYLGQSALFSAQDFDTDDVIKACDNIMAHSSEIRASLAEQSAKLTKLAETDIAAVIKML